MLTVGLTGGIACGKSHILREFDRLGVYTIDADAIAHRVILPRQPAYDEIVAAFGKEILAPDGSIDRKKLGELVFADEALLQKLNRIVHPLVFEEEQRLIAGYEAQPHPRSPIIMVDAALMVEAGSYRNYDFVIVVYCHPAIQLRRLMARDGFSEEEATRRIGSQMPLLEKIKYADYIVENSGRLSEVRAQVRYIFADLVHGYEESQG